MGNDQKGAGRDGVTIGRILLPGDLEAVTLLDRKMKGISRKVATNDATWKHTIADERKYRLYAAELLKLHGHRWSLLSRPLHSLSAAAASGPE